MRRCRSVGLDRKFRPISVTDIIFLTKQVIKESRRVVGEPIKRHHDDARKVAAGDRSSLRKSINLSDLIKPIDKLIKTHLL